MSNLEELTNEASAIRKDISGIAEQGGRTSLDELIQQYCPDGVKYYHLNDVATIKRGERVTKAQLIPDGQYPVISGGVKPLGYLNRYNREANTITIAQYGTAGYVDWQQSPFWANDVCYSVFSLKIINNRFLYFVLLHNQQLLYSLKTNAIPACLPLDKLAGVEIPVPPLPVQEEIVRMLDKFTELQAELQTELQKRKQQYNYYLDNLLSFNRGGYQTEVRWMKIGDICDVFTGGEVPMESIKGNTPLGSFIYPIWGNGKDIYGYSTTYQIDKDAVCISSIGANTGAVFFRKAYFTPIIRLKVLIPRNTSISVKYLFYILSFVGFDVKRSSVPNMNSNEVKQKVIPVPSLADQQKIVSILDRFDRLTNDLSSGLPAEMEKRRLQYEYYRDKLLRFK